MSLFKKILVAVDLGDLTSSKLVLKAGLELTDDTQMLNVVCVVPDYGMSVVGSFFPEGHEKEALEQAQEALHKFTEENVPAGHPVQHIIAHGNIYEEIIDAAEKVGADAIVIGSHRPKLKDYLLGPNAARVVRHAEQSVLVVRTTER